MAGKKKEGQDAHGGGDDFSLGFDADDEGFGGFPDDGGDLDLEGLGEFEELPDPDKGFPVEETDGDPESEFGDLADAGPAQIAHGAGNAPAFGESPDDGFGEDDLSGDDFGDSFGEDDFDEEEDAENEGIDDADGDPDINYASSPRHGMKKAGAAAAAVAALGVVGYFGWTQLAPMVMDSPAQVPRTADVQTPAAPSLPPFPPATNSEQSRTGLPSPSPSPSPAPPVTKALSAAVPDTPIPELTADALPTGGVNRRSDTVAQLPPPSPREASMSSQVPATPSGVGVDALQSIETNISEVLAEIRAMHERIERLEETALSKSAVFDRFGEIEDRIEVIERRLAMTSAAPKGSTNHTPVSSVPEVNAKPRGADLEPPLKPAIIDEYRLKGASRGFAWVESDHGIEEVTVGHDLPGAGLVRAVERVDSQWVLVAEGGVIVQ